MKIQTSKDSLFLLSVCKPLTHLCVCLLFVCYFFKLIFFFPTTFLLTKKSHRPKKSTLKAKVSPSASLIKSGTEEEEEE